jgi:hypothetical protein
MKQCYVLSIQTNESILQQVAKHLRPRIGFGGGVEFYIDIFLSIKTLNIICYTSLY